MKLFNRKPKDKIKVATAFTLKGLTNGTVLDQLTEERYNKIKRKADQNKLHENEGR